LKHQSFINQQHQHAQQAYQAQLAAAHQQQQAKEQSAQIQEMLMRALRPQAPQIVVAPAAVVTTGMGVRGPPPRERSMPPVGGVATYNNGGPTMGVSVGFGGAGSSVAPALIGGIAGGGETAVDMFGGPRGFAVKASRLAPPPEAPNNNGNKSSSYFGTYKKPSEEQTISDTTIITINRSLDVTRTRLKRENKIELR
jgi:hypothetical protein